MGNSVSVKVLNFEKYKGRRDVTHNSWFRCSNRLLEDPDFYDFISDELLAWIYILSLTSQKNSDTVTINFDHAEKVCRIRKKHFESAIEKLQGKQILLADDTQTLRGRNVDDTQTCATRQDITEHNKQDIECSQVITPLSQLQLSDLDYFNSIKEISPELVAKWRQEYPEDWINLELSKARMWCLANPKKKPKATGQFLNNWFSRGWESHRKSIQSNKTTVGVFDFLNDKKETA